MRIKEIREDAIIFDNNNRISFYHDIDCSECNYADFSQLDDYARNYDFDENQMHFEFVENAGFRFGDNRAMHFVPCYSEQNGYYSCDIDIYYNGNRVCYGEADEILC